MTRLKELYFTIQRWDGFSVRYDLTEYGDVIPIFDRGGGYAVGGASKCFEIKADDLSWNNFAYTIMPALIEQTRGKAANLLIGGWVDDDGTAYLELSDIVHDRKQAIELGKEREEKAIYDLWNNEEIKLT